MITIPDSIGFITNVASLLTQIGVNSQTPNYGLLINIIKTIKDQADQIMVKGLIEDLAQRVQVLENNQVSIEYFSSPQFVKELSTLLYSQQLDDINEKKCLYNNYFVSCCRCASIEKLNIQKYYSLLQNLDIIEYHILTLLPENNIASCNASSLYHRMKDQYSEITKKDIKMRLDVLEGNNLTISKTFQEINVSPNRRGNIKAIGEDEYYIKTTLGTKFLSFIQNK